MIYTWNRVSRFMYERFWDTDGERQISEDAEASKRGLL
jgi:hypothetical protein